MREPREPLLCYAPHRRGVAGRERVVGRRAGDLDEVGTGFRHEPLEGLTASKRRSAGGGADAGAVLGDAMEIDEVVFHEPERGQITWGRVDLDAEVPADHEVRAIAAVVDKLDLRGLCAEVRARGEIAGAPATDPKILLGLWAYATRDGVGSGREIARLVELHAAYRWLCGGGAVAYHRLNDFRSDHGDVFSELVLQLWRAHETRPHRSPSRRPGRHPHPRLRRRCVVSKR